MNIIVDKKFELYFVSTSEYFLEPPKGCVSNSHPDVGTGLPHIRGTDGLTAIEIVFLLVRNKKSTSLIGLNDTIFSTNQKIC